MAWWEGAGLGGLIAGLLLGWLGRALLARRPADHAQRANLAVLAVLVLAFLGWWAVRPWPSPDTATLARGDEGPVRMRLSDSALELRRDGERLVLQGRVPDEAAHAALRDAAQRNFGPARVLDRLQVDTAADAMPWLAHADALLAQMQAAGPDASVRVLGQAVALGGTARHADERDARLTQLRRWFGARYQVDDRTQLTGVVAAVMASGVASTGAGRTSGAAVCDAMDPDVAIAFRPGRIALAPQGRAQLDSLLPCLSGRRWVVGVHTDSGGTPEGNLALTQARAQAVVAHLVRRGLPADRLVARGMGAMEPVADNAEPQGRLRNRRVSFTPAD